MTESGKKAYYLIRAKELTGFAACDENGEFIGVIIALPDSMQAPLDSVRLFIEVFVKEEYRKTGIGRALLFEMYWFAKENGAVQLTNTAQTAEHIGFWYEIGFDVFFWDANPNTGEYGTTAMLRVE